MSKIIELFGFDPLDQTITAIETRSQLRCPFVKKKCSKTLSDGTISGVCTLKPKTSGPVICCPQRLYANNYSILHQVSKDAFGSELPLLPAKDVASYKEPCVAVFGKGWGRELRLPSRGIGGSYFVDWVLARTDATGHLQDFVAVEVQSIDTTGNYRAERAAYLNGTIPLRDSTAGFNWENVNKRILPQLIYKGHVLRQEPLCRKGLYFICPAPVYRKISERLGGGLKPYPIQPGSLTIMWHDVAEAPTLGTPRELLMKGKFTTTIDQVALAFTAPSNLPPAQVYENAIRSELDK